MLEALALFLYSQLYLLVIKLVAMTYVAIHMYKLRYDNHHTLIWLHGQIIIFNLFIIKSYLLLRGASVDMLGEREFTLNSYSKVLSFNYPFEMLFI